MMGDLVKAIELVLNTVRAATGADSKREGLAKSVLQIYLNIGEVIERGRSILLLASSANSAEFQPVSINLLTLQQQSLDELIQSMTSGTVGSMLELHLPNSRKSLLCCKQF
jgi:hypothetical protein